MIDLLNSIAAFKLPASRNIKKDAKREKEKKRVTTHRPASPTLITPLLARIMGMGSAVFNIGGASVTTTALPAFKLSLAFPFCPAVTSFFSTPHHCSVPSLLHFGATAAEFLFLYKFELLTPKPSIVLQEAIEVLEALVPLPE